NPSCGRPSDDRAPPPLAAGPPAPARPARQSVHGPSPARAPRPSTRRRRARPRLGSSQPRRARGRRRHPGGGEEARADGMPTWQDFQPFIVAGLALGGVYALSGVGMVVLYRATGVLNLAFGAVG